MKQLQCFPFIGQIFCEKFKGHPSLGPGTVEDSVAVTLPIAGEDDIAMHEFEAEFASMTILQGAQ